MDLFQQPDDDNVSVSVPVKLSDRVSFKCSKDDDPDYIKVAMTSHFSFKKSNLSGFHEGASEIIAQVLRRLANEVEDTDSESIYNWCFLDIEKVMKGEK